MDDSDFTANAKSGIRAGWCAICFVVMFVPCLITSCGKKSRNEVVEGFTDMRTIPSIRTCDVITMISDSGITRYKIEAPEWQMFENADDPYWYFPQGIYVEQFDSLFRTEAFIVGDTAVYYKNKQLWELNGNVRMENVKDEIFLTEQLFWDQRKQELYSDSDIHIQRVDKIIEGKGFVSNESMTRYTIKQTTGIFPMNEEQQPAPNDSAREAARNNAQRYAPDKKGGER
ncbi:MAG: LPS export ABC transporter periplasmic protein LptC [Coprobacter sp.]|nr:LPS export ABC transporter periplasmic protein LptC [Coprobacter sp.]